MQELANLQPVSIMAQLLLEMRQDRSEENTTSRKTYNQVGVPSPGYSAKIHKRGCVRKVSAERKL
jgi:hypothetical protein